MHPNKFFDEVNCKIGLDTFEIFDNDLQRELSNLHPLNFIKTKITLPVYKIDMTYYTNKGNYKNVNKYMIMDSSFDDEYCDMWAEMFAEDYAKEHNLHDVKIGEVTKICDAVLPIG